MKHKIIGIIILLVVIIIGINFFSGMFNNNNEHFCASAEASAENVSISVLNHDPGRQSKFYVSREDNFYYYGQVVDGYEPEGEYELKFNANVSNLDWNISPSKGHEDLDLNETKIKNFLNDYFKNNSTIHNYELSDGQDINWQINTDLIDWGSISHDITILNTSIIIENGILTVNQKYEAEGSLTNDVDDWDYRIYLENPDDDNYVTINFKIPKKALNSVINLSDNYDDGSYELIFDD